MGGCGAWPWGVGVSVGVGGGKRVVEVGGWGARRFGGWVESWSLVDVDAISKRPQRKLFFGSLSMFIQLHFTRLITHRPDRVEVRARSVARASRSRERPVSLSRVWFFGGNLFTHVTPLGYKWRDFIYYHLF